jgi:hypothetical protein
LFVVVLRLKACFHPRDVVLHLDRRFPRLLREFQVHIK